MVTISKSILPKHAYRKNRDNGDRVYKKGEANHTFKKIRYSIDPATGCWNWLLKIENSGYGRVTLTGVRKQIQAHVAEYEKKYGPVPEGKVLDHTCKNPICVNPDHLEPVTQLENIARSNIFKLTKEQAEEIRALVANGKSQAEVARLYNVSQSNVSKICLFKSRTKI
jgi:hypothetical protein